MIPPIKQQGLQQQGLFLPHMKKQKITIIIATSVRYKAT